MLTETRQIVMKRSNGGHGTNRFTQKWKRHMGSVVLHYTLHVEMKEQHSKL